MGIPIKRIQTRRGRYDRDYRFGEWPWHIRPAGFGTGGSLNVSWADVSISGSDSTPIGDSGSTQVYGSSSIISGKMPDLNSNSCNYIFTPLGVSFGQEEYSETTTSFSSYASFGVCMYVGTNRILFQLPDIGYFDCNSSYYMHNYAVNFSLNPEPGPGGYGHWGETIGQSQMQLQPGGWIPGFPTQPWLPPGETVVIPTATGLWMNCSRGYFSLSARMTFWWYNPS